MQLIYKFGDMGMFDCVNLALENFSHLGLNSSQEFMTFCHDNIKIIKLIIMGHTKSRTRSDPHRQSRTKPFYRVLGGIKRFQIIFYIINRCQAVICITY
jgi:hypothetical protein